MRLKFRVEGLLAGITRPLSAEQHNNKCPAAVSFCGGLLKLNSLCSIIRKVWKHCKKKTGLPGACGCA